MKGRIVDLRLGFGIRTRQMALIIDWLKKGGEREGHFCQIASDLHKGSPPSSAL